MWFSPFSGLLHIFIFFLKVKTMCFRFSSCMGVFLDKKLIDGEKDFGYNVMQS
jgi:hypothetical protein